MMVASIKSSGYFARYALEVDNGFKHGFVCRESWVCSQSLCKSQGPLSGGRHENLEQISPDLETVSITKTCQL